MTNMISTFPMSCTQDSNGNMKQTSIQEQSVTGLESMYKEGDFEPVPIIERNTDRSTLDALHIQKSDSSLHVSDECVDKTSNCENEREELPEILLLDPIPWKCRNHKKQKDIEDFSKASSSTLPSFIAVPPQVEVKALTHSAEQDPMSTGDITRSQEAQSHLPLIRHSDMISSTNPTELHDISDEINPSLSLNSFGGTITSQQHRGQIETDQDHNSPVKRRVSMPTFPSYNSSQDIQVENQHTLNGPRLTHDIPKAAMVYSQNDQVSFGMHQTIKLGGQQAMFNSIQSFQPCNDTIMQDSSIDATVATSSTGAGNCRDHHAEIQDDVDMSEEDGLSMNLKVMMMKSSVSQRALQSWDKKMGLPKNHSPCMMKSNLSRRQLQENVLLKTHTGTLLIDAVKNSANRSKNVKLQHQMERRNTCPT
jgi:hypothetical protein